MDSGQAGGEQVPPANRDNHTTAQRWRTQRLWQWDRGGPSYSNELESLHGFSVWPCDSVVAAHE